MGGFEKWNSIIWARVCCAEISLQMAELCPKTKGNAELKECCQVHFCGLTREGRAFEHFQEI